MTTDNTQTRRSLLLLAIVNDEVRQSNDILQAISPIFHPIAQKLAGRQYVVAEFAEELRTDFGLSIPHDVLQEFAEPLKAAGLLEKTRAGGISHLFFWKKADHPAAPISDNADIVQSIDRIVVSFIEFCNNQNDLFFHNWDQKRASDVLFDYLVDNDRDVARAKRIIQNKTSYEDSVEDYVCARFIQSLKELSDKDFDLISGISSALLISEVVIELSSSQRSSHSDSNLMVYLDAPVMIHALNLSGKERYEFATELIGALRERGVSPRIFRHSVEEMVAVLKAVAEKDPTQRTGLTASAILKGQTSIQLVNNAIANPEEEIQELGVVIDEVEIENIPQNQRPFATAADFNEIYAKLLAVHPENPYARDADAKSIALILAKRQGAKHANIFRSRFILLTDNSGVEDIAKRYVVENKGYAARLVGPAISLSRMAAAIWIDGGLAKGMSISRSQLLATCARTTALSPGLAERIRQNIRQINPDNADKYLALMAQPRYLQLANDRAYGGAKEITEQFTKDLFDEITREIVAPERAAHAAELAEVEKKTRAKDREHRKQMRAAQIEHENAAAEIYVSIAARLKRARGWGTALGFAMAAAVVFFALVVCAVIAASNFLPEYSVGPMPLAWIIAVLAFTLSLASFFAKGVRLTRIVARAQEFTIQRELKKIKIDYRAIGNSFEFSWDPDAKEFQVGNKPESVELKV